MRMGKRKRSSKWMLIWMEWIGLIVTTTEPEVEPAMETVHAAESRAKQDKEKDADSVPREADVVEVDADAVPRATNMEVDTDVG